jgi:hypothetical protein
MEEDEYKATYREIAKTRCVFEKALTNNQCKCRFSRHFWLADREGYACNSDENASVCSYFLEKLRENSRFFLKIHSVGAQLPHNVDIRVQVGGLRGLRTVFDDNGSDQPIADIKALVEQAETQFDSLDLLPYSEIVQSIASYQGRSRSKKGHKSGKKDV